MLQISLYGKLRDNANPDNTTRKLISLVLDWAKKHDSEYAISTISQVLGEKQLLCVLHTTHGSASLYLDYDSRRFAYLAGILPKPEAFIDYVALARFANVIEKYESKLNISVTDSKDVCGLLKHKDVNRAREEFAKLIQLEDELASW